MRFAKPATTLDQQVDLLISRGMAVSDKALARRYLSHINYYRLAGYWLPFEADHSTHTFHPGTKFDDVLSLYIFDRELRLLVMDAIERFEVSIRTQWAYHLAHAHGPHSYLDRHLFSNPTAHQICFEKLEEELNRSKEVFVSHYKAKYSDPRTPPVWAVVEVMSLGQLSKWVSGLAHGKDRQAVSRTYGIDEVVTTSFLHHLTIVRNICAHHSRLWNRRFGFQAKMPRHPRALNQSLNPQRPKYLYNTLALLEHFMNIINPDHHWKQRLIALLQRHPIANPEAMGFPTQWQTLPVWR